MSKILIVDDEKDLAEITGELLEFKGYEAELAKSGYEAIEKASKTSFDLCLLDIRLPDMNGVEVFLRIKEILPQMRIIMMTGFAVEDLIEEALKQGVYACIHKPFDMKRLLELIEEALKQKRRIILIADDIEEIRKRIGIFLKDKGYAVCEAESGKEAISKVKERHYDIILLDYGLPDINGLEVFREAKNIDPNIIAILMLDKSLEVLAKEALEEGFYGCITKPIDPERLLEMVAGIEDALRRR